MNSISRVFEKIKAFDFFSTPVSLKINSESSYKSYFSAFVSVSLSIVFIVILSVNLSQVLNYQKITTTVKEQKIIDQWRVNSTFWGFSLMVDGLIYEQFITMFKSQIVYYEGRKPKQRYSLHPCQYQNWPGIQKASFKKYKIDQMLCPQVDFNTTFYLEETYRQHKANFLSLYLNPCDTRQVFCNRHLLQDYISRRSTLYDGLVVHLFVYDFEVSEHLISSISPKINMQSNTILTATLGDRVFIQFQTFKISTDTGILFASNIQEISGNRVGAISHQPLSYNISELQSNNSLVIFTFTMNSNFKIYTRAVSNLLDAISKTGGLFYAFIPIIGVIIATYNTYCCNLLISKKMFIKTEEESKRNSEKLSTFFKYTIYSFFGDMFSYRIDWKDCKQIELKKKEADSLMEVDNIFRRVQNLQTFSRHSIDKNEAICLLLTELPSLKQSKLHRYQVNYSCLILTDSPGTTINSVRKKMDNWSGSLTKLTKMLLQKEKKSTVQGNDKLGWNQLGMESIKQLQLEDKEANSQQDQNQLGCASPRRDKQKQFKKGKADLQVLSQFLKCFPELQKRAEQIQISTIYKKVERSFAKCFFNMRTRVRISLQQRIPIIILIRLMKIIRVLKQQRLLKKMQKRSQESNYQGAQIEKEDQLNFVELGQDAFFVQGNQAKDLAKQM